MKQQNNTDAELTPEGAYPHKLECVDGKAGSVFHHFFLVSTPNWACSWPTASTSGEGMGMQQSGCSNSWLSAPLEVHMERWEQKREERRKKLNIWAEVMSLSPLKPQFWRAKSDVNKYSREGRRDTGWAQPNLSLCVWSGCELPWRDGWKLLGNSKSKEKMNMRTGNGRDTMQTAG